MVWGRLDDLNGRPAHNAWQLHVDRLSVYNKRRPIHACYERTPSPAACPPARACPRRPIRRIETVPHTNNFNTVKNKHPSPAACPPAHTRPHRPQRSGSPSGAWTPAGSLRGCPGACLNGVHAGVGSVEVGRQSTDEAHRMEANRARPVRARSPRRWPACPVSSRPLRNTHQRTHPCQALTFLECDFVLRQLGPRQGEHEQLAALALCGQTAAGASVQCRLLSKWRRVAREDPAPSPVPHPPPITPPSCPPTHPINPSPTQPPTHPSTYPPNRPPPHTPALMSSSSDHTHSSRSTTQ